MNVSVILTLLGFLTALGGFILSLVKSINEFSNNISAMLAQLKIAVDDLTINVNQLRDENKQSHLRLWKHNDEQDDILSEHEQRLIILEKGDKQK